jgi:hypothetical protein
MSIDVDGMRLPPDTAFEKTTFALFVQLAPGATCWERIDIAEWAAGGGALHGRQALALEYAWRGVVSARIGVDPP